MVGDRYTSICGLHACAKNYKLLKCLFVFVAVFSKHRMIKELKNMKYFTISICI